MATIGDLVVNLSARTAPFSKGLGGASKRLSRFASGVASTITRVTAFGGALVGVAGVGGLGLMVKQSLASIDATAKLADRINATTEDLTALGFAAQQTGASQESLNSSLTRMSRRIGLFAKGTGAAKSALEQLGFAAEDLTRLSAGEQFREIVARISELPTVAQRGAAAFEIFGQSGQQLMGLIDAGPEGLRQLSDEADRLGLTFSRLDAAKVEAANDAMNRVKRAVGGAAQDLTIKLAPAIEAVANFAAESLVPAFGDVGGTVDDLLFGFQNFGDTAKLTLLDLVAEGLRAFPELQKPIEQLAAVFVGSWAGTKAFFGSIIDNMIGGLKELANFAKAVAAGISAAFASIKSGDIAGAAGAFGDAFINTLANQKDVKADNAFTAYRDAFMQARQETLSSFDAAGGLTGFIDEQRQKTLDALTQRAIEFDEAKKNAQAGRNKFAFEFDPDAAGGTGRAGPPQFAEALRLGSAEGFDAIARAIGGGPQSEAKKQTDALQALKTGQDEQQTELEKIARNTRQQDRPVTVTGG